MLVGGETSNQWRRNEFESGGAPVWRESAGSTCPLQSAGKFFLVVTLHFLALNVQLVVFVSAFVVVSTAVWSVSCLLFYLQCPCAQPFVKVGERAPPPLCPMESAPLPATDLSTTSRRVCVNALLSDQSQRSIICT